MERLNEETLAVLACDLGARPAGAPTLDDVLPRIRKVHREPSALVLGFAAANLAVIDAFAAAERLCCAEIEWSIDARSAELRIAAMPTQLDALQAVFETKNS